MPKIKKDLKYYVDNFDNYSERLPWKKFIDVLTKHYGFEMENGDGSARLFILGQIRFSAHEPHGREKFVSKYDRKKAIKFVNSIK
jgi:hypothetical protein